MTKQVGNKKTQIYSLKNSLLRYKRDSNRWSIYTLAIVFFIALPILTIFFKLFSGPGETWGHVVENLLLTYVSNSLYLIVGSSITVLLLGVFSAWFVSRYDFPFRKQLEWLLILPLAIPSYITAYAYAGIFDYGGTLELLSGTVGMTFPKIDIMNNNGLVFVLSMSLYPYVYVSARSVFLTQSKNLIEASQLLGAGEIRTFFKVVLPMARPAIVGGLILVLMEVLNDYGAAKYFGVNTFTTGIFRSWFSLEEPETAIYLSALLIALIFILMTIERWQRRSICYHSNSKNDQTLTRKTTMGTEKGLIFTLTFIPVLLGFIIPVLQLLYWAFLSFNEVFSYDFLLLSFQSLAIAFTAALATVVLVVFLIYGVKWNKLRIVRSISKVAVLGYAIPGAVIAVGVMVPVLFFDKWLVDVALEYFSVNIGLVLSGTVIALIYAYMVRFLAVAYSPIESNSLKVGKSISESSNILGVSNWKTLFKIELPLIKTGLMSGMILVFVDVMKELPLTLILKPYDINTLAVSAYEYASDEMVVESALPSLLIIITGVLPIIFLNKLITK